MKWIAAGFGLAGSLVGLVGSLVLMGRWFSAYSPWVVVLGVVGIGFSVLGIVGAAIAYQGASNGAAQILALAAIGQLGVSWIPLGTFYIAGAALLLVAAAVALRIREPRPPTGDM